MDRNQVRTSLLKITLLVLLGTTWVFWSFILSTRPQGSVDTLSTLARLPASLPAQIPGLNTVLPGLPQNLSGLEHQSRAMEAIPMDVVQIPCWDNSKGLEEPTAARWVRLTGKSCQDDAVHIVSVRNLTNGYDATVFPVHGAALTTDYIPLQRGRNEIMIRYDAGEGAALESRIQFTRQ